MRTTAVLDGDEWVINGSKERRRRVAQHRVQLPAAHAHVAAVEQRIGQHVLQDLGDDESRERAGSRGLDVLSRLKREIFPVMLR
jgi:hypothetical protein